MSWPNIVGWLWPSAFTSVMPHRLASSWCAATSAASHTEPSADLAVAEQHVGAVGRPDPARVERDADRRAAAPGRATRSRRPRTAGAASGVPRGPTRSAAASAVRGGRTPRPRPTRRTAAARRAPWRARTGRYRDPAGASGRSASPRRTAPPRCRRPSSRSTGGRCRRRSSRGSSRSADGWRRCAGPESGHCQQALVTSRWRDAQMRWPSPYYNGTSHGTHDHPHSRRRHRPRGHARRRAHHRRGGRLASTGTPRMPARRPWTRTASRCRRASSTRSAATRWRSRAR